MLIFWYPFWYIRVYRLSFVLRISAQTFERFINDGGLNSFRNYCETFFEMIYIKLYLKYRIITFITQSGYMFSCVNVNLSLNKPNSLITESAQINLSLIVSIQIVKVN